MSDNNITKSNISTSEQLFAEIRQILIGARQTAYKAVNFAMVTAYWNIGRLIVEDEQQGSTRAEYGKAVLADLSVRLTEEFGKGFTEANLRNMRQFYQCFPNCYALRSELTWTHYRLLIRVQDEAARQWYMNEAAEQTWSSRQLDRQISVLYYERLLASKDTRPVREEAAQNLSLITPQEFIHDPYVLEFLNLKDYPALRETDIEKALISNLQEFLLELGKGFCFVARQKRMRYEEEDFYVDLVFYHSILKCHVLIDLKLGKLSHQDVGQMDSYIRMFDDLYKHPDDNPTLGLILCSDKNEAVVKYSVLAEHRQIFASKYLLELPAPEVLQREIMRERKQLEG
jgi:predicted nuclease of restriction endonuclease-like (RecB) superfamily